MDGIYDYFQHPYCINYSFDEDGAHAKYAKFLAVTDTKQYVFDDKKELKASILYNSVTGAIYWRGYNADKKYRRYQMEHKELVYVKNVFVELYDIFLKKSEIATHYDIVSKEVINILKNSLDDRYDSYHFSFTVPTYWDMDIQEKLLRPLFIRAGLIYESDHSKRLLFITQLTSNFRYLFQDRRNMLLRDREYIVCRYKIADKELTVDLDLLIARSPYFLMMNAKELLPAHKKSAHFTVPFISSLESDIDACVKKINPDIEPEEKEQLKKLFKRFNRHKALSKSSFSKEGNSGAHLLFRHFLSPKKWDLFEVEISRLQSVTLKDIHEEMFESIKSAFLEQLNILLKPDYRTTRVAILLSRDTEYKDSDSYVYMVLFDWLQQMLREFGEFPFNFDLMKIVKKVVSMVNANNTIEGSILQLKQQIASQYQESRDFNIPTIRSYDSSKESLLRGESFHFVNIEISLGAIRSTFSVVGQDHHVEYLTMHNHYNIQPLSSFFDQSINDYRRLPLCVDKRIKVIMDELFYNAKKVDMSKEDLGIKMLDFFRHPGRASAEEAYKTSFDKQELFNLFLNKSRKFHDADSMTYLYQKEYKDLFLAIYMGVLKNLVIYQLNEAFGIEWKVKNVGYFINAEKILFDNFIGSKNGLKNLLVKGNYGDASKKGDILRITTQECILPAIAQKLKMDIVTGRYFVVAKLQKSFIQITLHQVIKASLVIKDEIIMLDNVLDKLCKNLLLFIANHDGIKCCDRHKHKKENLYLLQNFNEAISQLKKSLEERMSSLDTNSNFFVSISRYCDCGVWLAFRDIIDIGLKPIIRDIADTITGTLQNSQIFGYYEVDFILLTGNIFTLSLYTPMYEVYLNLLQSEIEDSMEVKEVGTPFCVLRESLSQFLRPYGNSRLYEYDCLINGDLQLVSSETYAIYIGGFHNRDSNKEISKPFLSFNKKINDAKFGGDANTALLILKTGQPISDKRNVTQLKVELQNEIEINLDSHYVLTLVLARLKHTENTVEGEIISLDSISYDDIYEFPVVYDYHNRNFEAPIRFETRYFSHNSTLQFTLGMTEDQRISIPQKPSAAYM